MIKEITKENIKLKMDIETDFEEHRFAHFFDKEPETIAWIEQVVKEGDIFYDIGANIGIYSLYASIFFGDKVKVLSFEPVYHNFQKLCKNIAANGLKNNLPYCVAVSEKTQFETIELASNISGSASHLLASAPKELFDNFMPQFKQGIFCSTLDDLILRYGLPCPNHIKIDVDGVEENIISGAKNTLRNSNLKSILVEVTDDNSGEKERIKKAMFDAGFKIEHPVNFLPNKRERRQRTGNFDLLENIIFTK